MSGKIYYRFFIVFVSILLAVVAAHGQDSAETQVSISVSNSLGFVGDKINLKIIVKTSNDNAQDIDVHIDQKEYETLNRPVTEIRRQPGFIVLEKNFTIAFFKVGTFEVGPLTVDVIAGNQVIDSKKTNSVPVNIKSVLKEDDKDIKPLKSLADIKGRPWYLLKYVLLAVLVIVLTIIVIITLIKRRNAIPPPPKPLMSPLDELEFLLKELAGKKLFEKGKIKIYFIELTLLLKRFLNRNYGFNAEDSTTEETLYALKQAEQENLIRDNLRFVFNTADLVKFAKFIPDNPVLTELEEKIKEIITRYKLRISMNASSAQAASGKTAGSLKGGVK